MNLKTCAIYLLITLSTAAIANNHGLQKVPGNDGNYPVPHEDFSLTIKGTGRNSTEAAAIAREKAMKAVQAVLVKKGYSQVLLSSYRFIEDGVIADKYKLRLDITTMP